ncbi:MAG: cytidine deaminase [Bacilli bacterium]|nr:cytidine deaminase [Bacilli bacterium]
MYKEDIELAKKARLNACSPYSNFEVGTALRTKSGKVYTGSNIENHGIQGICAERTAFVKALSEGEREFKSITIVGAKKNEEVKEKCMPCGYCRQFMSEYVDKDFKIVVVNADDSYEEYSIEDLLPHSFDF